MIDEHANKFNNIDELCEPRVTFFICLYEILVPISTSNWQYLGGTDFP